MREHMGLYRGKRLDNGEWIEGSVAIFRNVRNELYHAIIPVENGENVIQKIKRVDPETVGECSGMPDKNGKLIFEGDIVEGLFLYGNIIRAEVGFRDGSFGLIWKRGEVKEFTPFTSTCNVEYEIIGNIHDNPELLEGARENETD